MLVVMMDYVHTNFIMNYATKGLHHREVAAGYGKHVSIDGNFSRGALE